MAVYALQIINFMLIYFMMMKKIFVLFLLFSGKIAEAQTLQSPAEFLGYELGTKFTDHSNIVRYFEKTTAAAPATVKLEQYGTTYEGRPLLLAIISAPENIARISEIRKNNLRLTGLLKDAPGDATGPAIVWLSYNVHGNEPSSSEVALKMLYELVGGKNTSLNAWLKNIVVIIDPCLNPDGRERYVSWFNQMSGKFPNADPNAREHDEPWPQGRTNHYNFDLNRDWAWQTQKESEARLKIYQQWMPQIHCDFHEQGPESPYYFAPAAEPVHEAISQWQKDFQVTVGKNHARYFDANGWLYFTKQYFDLFYPSYGDTYPLLNGAIGMTYEQAGHSRGGVSLAQPNGDTLTLAARIEHHFTTGMSTIETASGNAPTLVRSFKKYFDDNIAGTANAFKTYIVSNNTGGNVTALKELLTKNNIRFGYASASATIKAFSYFSGKEGTVTLNQNDLVIPSGQPQGSLLRVLFEQQSKLNDSATYDITAWALPYTYGLASYATKEAIAFSGTDKTAAYVQPAENSYAYIVAMNNFDDSRLLAALLQQDFRLHFSETPFSFNNMKYPAGSILVIRRENEGRIPKLLATAALFNSHVNAVSSGFMQTGFDFGSDKVHFIKDPSVAMLTGKEISSAAAGEIWYLFEQQLNRPVTLLNAADFSAVDLKDYDVLIIPDGNSRILKSKESAADLKQWIEAGGRLIALEYSAKQIAGLDWGIKLKKLPEEKADTTASYADIKKFADREKESVTGNIPGAIYRLQLDNTHPVAFGYPDFYYTLKQNDFVFEFLKSGWNIATIKKQQQVSGFVGSKVRETLNDGTLVGELPLGKGSVVFFADDPLFRSFWENGKMMFCNAVFFSTQ